MTKKETNLNGTLSEAVSVATSVAYTRQEIQKLKKEFVSLLEEKATEVIVEQVPGPIGPRGSIGANGAQGLKGDRGEVGERGEKGEVGESGSQGDVGQDGLRGEKGEQGDTGIQGVAGEIGQQGPKGDKGDDGKNGLDGRNGETGEMGSVGPAGKQGIQGEQGLRGDKGDRGERGENGQQGIQGSTGLRGESGQQGIQGVAGKDGKDADIKPVEEKFKKFQDVLEKDLQQYKNRINASVSKAIATDTYNSAGSGEVNLKHLDDIDRDSIQDGYVLSYSQANNKFVFVEQTGGSGGSGNGIVDFSAGRLNFSSGGSGNTIDTLARTTANTALSIAQSAFAQANTGGAAGTDNVARSIANSAFATANSATSLAQAAYNQANTGGAGASESLNVVFNNNNATQYKLVALNANGETILASSLDISQIDKILGVLDDESETVTFGGITNPAWTWTPEQSLYIGSNGSIVTTSTINGAAFSLKIGYAISSTKAFIKIGTPIVL